MAPIALAFAVLSLKGASAADLGWVIATRSAAQVLFLLAGGVIADRCSRRMVLIASEVIAGIAQLLLAALFFAHAAAIPYVLILVAVSGAASAAYWPAATGILPELVDSADMVSANGLLRISMNVAAIAGASLGGVIVTLAGADWALLADALTFLLSAILIAGVRRTTTAALTITESVLAALRTGWNEFRSRQWVWLIVAQFSLFNACFQGILTVLGPIVSKDYYGGAGFWAAMLVLQAVGLAAGSLISMLLRPARPIRAATLLTFGFLPALLLFGLRAPVWITGVAMLVYGGCYALFSVLWNSSLQNQISRDSISRVSSYDAVGSFALGPIGSAIAVPLAQDLGLGGTFTACFFLLFAASCAVLASPSVRHLTTPPPPLAATAADTR
jgi:MFS family permease